MKGHSLESEESLAHRSIVSVKWNIAASVFRTIILFARTVLLTRLLPIEIFGIYALAGAIIAVTSPLSNFGMHGAFLHRAPETENETHAAAVLFTLKLIFSFLWGGLLIMGAIVFTNGQARTALLALVLLRGGLQLTQTPRMILTRRVMHRRLAILQMSNSLATTCVALVLAWNGATLWCLLSVDIVSLFMAILLLYLWHPFWRPRLAWSSAVVNYYIRFGSRNFLSTMLAQLLDRLDDLWTGIFLGHSPLGFYSRAYRIASYPRIVLATPVSAMIGGTYAELKGYRQRLSVTFFNVNFLFTRCGFFLAGLLALIAPEFIITVLGVKWMPMLDVFRLLLVFAMLDPIKGSIGNLFIAVGKPECLVRARFIQLLMLVSGLFVLGRMFGIFGVAMAVNLMTAAGIAMLLVQAKEHIDMSIRQLFAVPIAGGVLSLFLAAWAGTIPGVSESDLAAALVKTSIFSFTYAVVILIFEFRQLIHIFQMIKQRITSDND